ncbi:hypothetical protein, partial [Flavobacterium sp.]|uniref:hypothetical protein n=1 Tax=Flavobacterium sp. TaxID=239 RepID=UPI003C6703AB
LYTSAGVVTATTQLGAYVNIATATAMTADGVTVSDDDAAHHIGVAVVPAKLIIKKAVNAVDPLHPTTAEDADVATGPTVSLPASVTFTYRVWAQGVEVKNVTLVDDNGTLTTSDDFAPTYLSGDTDGDGVLDLDEVWLFRAIRTALQGQYVNVATATGAADGNLLTSTDVAHYYGVAEDVVSGAILIKKAVNAVKPTAPTAAEDADSSASARLLASGSPVVWTYLVSNLTKKAITNIVVFDDNGTPSDTSDDFTPVYVSGDTNGNGALDKNEVWLFTSAGVRSFAAPMGLYGNRGIVTGRDSSGAAVRDEDTAWLFGATVAIDVEKYVNGVDADLAPGVQVAVGSTVTWTYTVTNRGNVALAVSLRDDNGTATASDDFTPTFVGGDTDGDGLLDVDEIWNYRWSGTAVAGTYRNLATVIGSFTATGQSAQDADAANSYAPYALLHLEKAVNALDPQNPTATEDANAAPGRRFAVGTPLVWTYLLTNLGITAVDVYGIVDDRGTPGNANDDFDAMPVMDVQGYNVGDTDHDGLLDPGEVWLFTSQGIVSDVVVAGLYVNTATVTGVIPGIDTELTATDYAHHVGT